MKKIVIIGSGIIGASLAYYLAKAGADVVVLDAGAAGGVATPNSWAWINASWGNPPEYVLLRLQAMAEWHAVSQIHVDLAVNWCGGLLWDLADDELEQFVLARQEVGYDIRLVDGGQVRQLEPQLKSSPVLAAYAAGEGVIEPAIAARGFLQMAVAQGAKFVSGACVTGFEMQGQLVTAVKCGAESFAANEVVVAAGATSAALLKMIGINLNMDAPAGLLVHSKPTRKILNGLIMAPELHVRQTSVGQLVAGSDFAGATPGDDPQGVAHRLFDVMKGTLRGHDDLEMDYFTIGYRPTPVDGLPAVGRLRGVDGIYVAVTHSGITLAPLLGKLGATEIMFDQRDALLMPFHPDRLCA